MRIPICAALLLIASPVLAEQIVLKDGTVVKGELVDFQGGVYTVKVGKFTKTIPEDRISDVRPDGATTTPGSSAPAATPPAAAAAPATQPEPLPGGIPQATPIYGGTPMPGAGQANRGQVDATLKQLGAGDPAISSAVQSMMSGGGLDPSALSQLQNNPAMEKLVERFHDPAYQKQLIDGLSQMNQGQRNPMVDQLQGLFQQLNSMQGQQGAPGH